MASIMDIADATTGVPSAALVTRATRRKFTPEFKRQVAAQCLLPGASLSAVALSHRINANVIRKWVRRAQQNTTSPTVPSTATMLAVNVMQAPVHKPPPPSRTCASSSAVPCIEILTAAGTVRLPPGFDAASLRAILQILAEPR